MTDRIWDIVWVNKLWPWEILKERRPQFDWGGIDPTVIEDLVLGHMVKATMKPALEVRVAADQEGKRVRAPLSAPEKLFAEPFAAAVKDLSKGLSEHFEMGVKLTRGLAR